MTMAATGLFPVALFGDGEAAVAGGGVARMRTGLGLLGTGGALGEPIGATDGWATGRLVVGLCG